MNFQTARENLLDRQQALTKRLNAVQADLKKSHSADWSEQAQERENDEVLEEIATQTSAELAQITQVLGRIEKGEYGVCSACGGSIAKERLEAIPEATTCIQCA